MGRRLSFSGVKTLDGGRAAGRCSGQSLRGEDSESTCSKVAAHASRLVRGGVLVIPNSLRVVAMMEVNSYSLFLAGFWASGGPEIT